MANSCDMIKRCFRRQHPEEFIPGTDIDPYFGPEVQSLAEDTAWHHPVPVPLSTIEDLVIFNAGSQ